MLLFAIIDSVLRKEPYKVTVPNTHTTLNSATFYYNRKIRTVYKYFDRNSTSAKSENFLFVENLRRALDPISNGTPVKTASKL